jgi:LCP family protein required for cell wall assembly
MKLRHIRPTRVFIRIAQFFRQHILLTFFIILLSLLASLGVLGFRFLQKHNVKAQDLLSFFGAPSENLDSTDGVTNFLILGIRGEGTDSPNLSDTIMVFSYNHDTKSPVMTSVPRDLWVPSLQAKINTAYYYGEQASPGAGIKFAQGAILEDLGLPIHYTAVVNFALFEQAIDLVGGIDVDVNPGFTDTEFPLPGKENAMPVSSRYETISFKTGTNHLDGSMALKFVRSRHAEGDEGTDFARSRRQQQVIAALRNKMLAPSFLLDKNKVNALFAIVSENLKSNIHGSLYPTLAKLALDTKDKNIRYVPLTDTPDDKGVTILYNPPIARYKNEWVLIPKDNNWNALKQYIQNHFHPSSLESSQR